MATHEDVHRARKNGSGCGMAPGAKPINSTRVMDLLVEAARPGSHFAVRRNANALIEMMAQARWRVTGGVHAGGRGGDQRIHITVSFGRGRSYHLILDARGHIYQATGDQLPRYLPSSAPGTSAQ